VALSPEEVGFVGGDRVDKLFELALEAAGCQQGVVFLKRLQAMMPQSPADPVAQQCDFSRLHTDARLAIDQPLKQGKLLGRERFDLPHGVGGLLSPARR
jgi:hypothetical protein